MNHRDFLSVWGTDGGWYVAVHPYARPNDIEDIALAVRFFCRADIYRTSIDEARQSAFFGDFLLDTMIEIAFRPLRCRFPRRRSRWLQDIKSGRHSYFLPTKPV